MAFLNGGWFEQVRGEQHGESKQLFVNTFLSPLVQLFVSGQGGEFVGILQVKGLAELTETLTEVRHDEPLDATLTRSSEDLLEAFAEATAAPGKTVPRSDPSDWKLFDVTVRFLPVELKTGMVDNAGMVSPGQDATREELSEEALHSPPRPVMSARERGLLRLLTESTGVEEATLAARSLAGLGRLSLPAAEQAGYLLQGLPAEAVAALCPAVGESLADPDAEPVRRHVARRVGGLIHDQDERITTAVRGMIGLWWPDPKTAEVRKVEAAFAGLKALQDGNGSTPSERAQSVRERIDDVMAGASAAAAPVLDSILKDAAGTKAEGDVALAVAKASCKLGLPLAGPYSAVPASLQKTEDALFGLARLGQAELPTLTEAELQKAQLQDRQKRDLPRRNLGITRDLSREGVMKFLDELHAELAKLHDQLVQAFQLALDTLEGKACPTFEENHELVKRINAEADALGVVFYCTDKEGKVGNKGAIVQVRLRCYDTAGSVSGLFEARTADSAKRPVASSVTWLPLLVGRPGEAPEITYTPARTGKTGKAD
ncbi:MAG: hypothetical protein U0797_00545 [Gemmataceae bacterium]